MKVKLGLQLRGVVLDELKSTNLEYMDTQPFIQGVDSRNKIYVYINKEVYRNLYQTVSSVSISYLLQNGRSTIKMSNNSMTEETIRNVVYKRYDFNLPTTVTAVAGNIQATIYVRYGTGDGQPYDFKYNVLNTVIASNTIEIIEDALNDAQSEILADLSEMRGNLQNAESIITNHEARINTLESHDTTQTGRIDTLNQTVYGNADGTTASTGLTSKVGALENDNATNKSDIANLKTRDINLQTQIDGLNAAQNLVDIVADLTALNSLSTTNLQSGDKVQVLVDSNHENASTVYNWTGSVWSYIGKYGQDGYTKAEANALLNQKADKSTTYTKTEVDTALDFKADKDTTYTKTEVDAKVGDVDDKFDYVYTKTEADDLLDDKQDTTIPEITINGTAYTNLEDAIEAINTFVSILSEEIGAIDGSGDTSLAERITALQTQVDTLNDAWDAFMDGTDADNITDTLLSVQQNIVSLGEEIASVENELQEEISGIFGLKSIKTIDLGSLTWNSASGFFTGFFSSTALPDYDVSLINSSSIPAIYTKKFRTIAQSNISSNTECIFLNNNGLIGIKTTNYNNATDFKAALDGVILYYSTEVKEVEKTVNKSLYNLGAFDIISGNKITRQTGYVDLSSLNWNNYNSTHGWVCVFNNKNATLPANSDTQAEIVCNNVKTKTANQVFGGTIGIALDYNGDLYYKSTNTSASVKPSGILQYKLATSYQDSPIENESILPLDSNMANKIRQKVVDGLNLWKFEQTIISQSSSGTPETRTLAVEPNTTYTFSVGANPYQVGIYDYGTNITYTMSSGTLQLTFTTGATTTQVDFYFRTTSSDTYTYTNIMFNKGTHIYPPSDFNQKEHITNDEATLLKQEEEKCRNKFTAYKWTNISATATGSTWTINSANSITLTYATARTMIYGNYQLKPYTTYTFSFVSSSQSSTSITISCDGTQYNSNMGETSLVFTTGSTGVASIRFYCNSATTITITNIMINIGTHAYPYQAYNGEIVHKVDIEPVLLWENSSPNSAYTSTGSGNPLTLNQALTNFKYLIFAVKWYATANNGIQYFKAKVDLTANSIHLFMINEGLTASRNAAIATSNSLYFEMGYLNSSVDNSTIIPVAIYGTNVL